MGQRPHRNEVHAGFSVGAYVLQRDSARGFQRHGEIEFADPLDRLTNLVRRHVVQQHRLGAMFQYPIEFLQRADLYFNLLRAAPIVQCSFDGLDRAPRQSNVIVLDQHTVAEIEAMIMAAATRHRVLVEQTQPGNGLARIQDYGLGPFHFVDVAPRERGDAAHPLHDFQDHALAGKDDARIMNDHRNRLSLT